MGTYALSAGYYDAYYKRAQQVPHSALYCYLCDVIYVLTQ